MRLLKARRPNIERLERRGDTAGLLKALVYEDPVIDREGAFVDLGTDVRLAAVAALARSESTHAEDGLVKALNDPEAAVRQSAALGLAQRGATGALPALCTAVAAWRHEPLEGAREETLRALAAVGGTGAAGALAVQMLTGEEALDHDDAAIIRRVADEQSPAGLEQTIETLCGEIAGQPERAGRLLALLAPESVEPLLDSLQSEPMQVPAAKALGATHDSRAVGALCELLYTAQAPGARAAAARALGEIRDPAAVESLLVASGDPDYEVRLAAAESFDRFGNVAVAIAVSAVAARGTSATPAAVAAATTPRALASTAALGASAESGEDETPPRPLAAQALRATSTRGAALLRRLVQRPR